jgi:hypothetical protein
MTAPREKAADLTDDQIISAIDESGLAGIGEQVGLALSLVRLGAFLAAPAEPAQDERLREALAGLVESATAEANEKGAGGFHLARLSDARDALAAEPIKQAGAEPVAWHYRYEDSEQDAVALDRWLPENRGGWIERPLVFGVAEPIRQEAAEPVGAVFGVERTVAGKYVASVALTAAFRHKPLIGLQVYATPAAAIGSREAAEPSEETLRAMRQAVIDSSHNFYFPSLDNMRAVYAAAIAHKGAA